MSCHVVFNEEEFPFQHGFLNTKQPEQVMPYPLNFSGLPLAGINSKLAAHESTENVSDSMRFQ